MKKKFLNSCYEWNRWIMTEYIDPSDVQPESFPCIVVYDTVHVQDVYGHFSMFKCAIIYPSDFT